MFQQVLWSDLVTYKVYRVIRSGLYVNDFHGFLVSNRNLEDRFQLFSTGYHFVQFTPNNLANVSNDLYHVKVSTSIVYEIKLPYLQQLKGVAKLTDMCWKVIEENNVDITSIKHLNIIDIYY